MCFFSTVQVSNQINSGYSKLFFTKGFESYDGVQFQQENRLLVSVDDISAVRSNYIRYLPFEL